MMNNNLDAIKSIDIFKENCKFHHIGLSVKSIVSLFPGTKPVIDPIQKVKVAFINLQGTTLELLEPLDETSPIYNNLKNNNKLCHICFEVSNINNAINNGEKKGFHVIQKPVPAVALGNRKICFLFHSDYHIIELLQR
ncbi:MAG TPA: VOC family protein [Pelagibacteraceae bacterium]|nr:VOC family protein [Pelagibacteraceae bacterium]